MGTFKKNGQLIDVEWLAAWQPGSSVFEEAGEVMKVFILSYTDSHPGTPTVPHVRIHRLYGNPAVSACIRSYGRTTSYKHKKHTNDIVRVLTTCKS